MLFKQYYATLSFKHMYPDTPYETLNEDFSNRCRLWATAYKTKLERYIIVQEYGDTETNPHVNFVMEFKKEMDNSNFRKLMKAIYSAEEQAKFTKYTLVCESVYDHFTLIGGYLQKETEGKGKVYDNWKYNLEECIAKKKIKVYKNDLPKTIDLILSHAAQMMINYANENNLTLNPTKSCFTDLLLTMNQGGYNIYPITSKVGWVFSEFCAKLGDNEFFKTLISNKIENDFKI